MKPTRHIPKLNRGLWTPKRNVWFKKNDDDSLARSLNRKTFDVDFVESGGREDTVTLNADSEEDLRNNEFKRWSKHSKILRVREHD